MNDDTSFGDAFLPLDVEEIGERVNTGDQKDGWTPIVPPPQELPTGKLRHPSLGFPIDVFPYHNAAGELEGYVQRFPTVGKDGEPDKTFRPLRFGTHKNQTTWHFLGWGDHRPLYRLRELLKTSSSIPVIVTEGERKANCAAEHFPDYAAVSPMNGAQSPHLTDWSHVKGRKVVIWPDNDDAGAGFAKKVAELCGALSVAIVSIPEGFPDGWDLADEPPDGWTYSSLRELLEASESVETSRKKVDSQPDSPVNGDQAEIERLAKLSEIAYEKERLSAAERLGMRISVLDKLVKAERPADPDAVGQGRRIEIPEVEPWPEMVDGSGLLDDFVTTVIRYVVLEPHQALAVALWVMFTHVFAAASFAPKLVIKAPTKRAGKTRLCEVLVRLVARPVMVSGITPAAIYRVIEDHSPTLVLDEFDALMKGDGDTREMLRGILNSGFTRAGARIIRNVPVGDGYEPRQFSTWCPQILAGIGNVPDTLADRSIQIELRRKLRSEKVSRLRHRDGGELDVLAQKAARWAKDNVGDLMDAQPLSPPTLDDRAADVWEALFAIADAAGGQWGEKARESGVILSAGDNDTKESLDELLLRDIWSVFKSRKEDKLPSKLLAADLAEMDGHPWSEFGRSGKAIKANGLARLLRKFHIAPDGVRIGGKTPNGYRLEQFQDVFERYVPDTVFSSSTPPQTAENQASQAESETPHNDMCGGLGSSSNPQNSGVCGFVDVEYEDMDEDVWEEGRNGTNHFEAYE